MVHYVYCITRCLYLVHSVLLYSTLPCSTLLQPILLHSTVLYSTLPYSAFLLYSPVPNCPLFYFTPLYATLLHSTLLQPTLPYPLLYSTLLYSTILYSTLLYSTPPCPTLLFGLPARNVSTSPQIWPGRGRHAAPPPWRLCEVAGSAADLPRAEDGPERGN